MPYAQVKRMMLEHALATLAAGVIVEEKDRNQAGCPQLLHSLPSSTRS